MNTRTLVFFAALSILRGAGPACAAELRIDDYRATALTLQLLRFGAMNQANPSIDGLTDFLITGASCVSSGNSAEYSCSITVPSEYPLPSQTLDLGATEATELYTNLVAIGVEPTPNGGNSTIRIKYASCRAQLWSDGSASDSYCWITE